MLKILALQNNITDQSTYTEGYRLYKEALEKATYEVQINFQNTSKTFNAKFYESTQAGSAIAPIAEEILSFLNTDYRILSLVYDSEKTIPHSTFPYHYLYNLRGCTPISVPLQWYVNSADSLCLYLLHETLHGAYMFAEKPDMTHLMTNRNLNPVEYDKYNGDAKKYYIAKLKELKQHLDVPGTKPASTVNFAPIKIGSKGDSVKEVQTLLGITVDGDFGKKTDKTIREFQKINGLIVDGIVGNNTIALLRLKKNEIDLSKWKLLPKLDRLAQQFLQTCKLKGYDIRITQGRRTQAEQNKLYAQGRTTPGKIVTWTLKSKHIDGKAFDYCFKGTNPYPKDTGQYKIIADIGKELGLSPGYYFKKNQDKLHFEI